MRHRRAHLAAVLAGVIAGAGTAHADAEAKTQRAIDFVERICVEAYPSFDTVASLAKDNALKREKVAGMEMFFDKKDGLALTVTPAVSFLGFTVMPGNCMVIVSDVAIDLVQRKIGVKGTKLRHRGQPMTEVWTRSSLIYRVVRKFKREDGADLYFIIMNHQFIGGGIALVVTTEPEV